jgi:hypothetical protein
MLISERRCMIHLPCQGSRLTSSRVPGTA